MGVMAITALRWIGTLEAVSRIVRTVANALRKMKRANINIYRKHMKAKVLNS